MIQKKTPSKKRSVVLGPQASPPAVSPRGSSVRSKQAGTTALPPRKTPALPAPVLPAEPLGTLKKRTRVIIRKLKKTYPDAKCSLNHSTPFELLVATILSAQCTDDRVNIVTAQLFRKYRKPEDYLKVSPRELEKDIQSTGFFRNKTKSIQGTSKMLTEKYGGEVPHTMEALLRDRRLLYVTGKGGVGKTTVAAALGVAAAQAGRRTIVCEVAEQDRVSRAFRREGVVPETEVQLADNLWAITIDPQRALEEWLGKQIGGVGLRVLARSSAFQYFVAAAPGAKELITIAKVWELAQRERWDRSNRTYDLVVVDAPSSGHGLAMLTTPRTFGEIARVGPIRRQAFKIRDQLADPERTGYVAVAVAEEMPVNETLELEQRLAETIGSQLEAIVVNGMWPERFSAADADALRASADGVRRCARR